MSRLGYSNLEREYLVMSYRFRFIFACASIVALAGLTGCGNNGGGAQTEADVETEQAADEAGYEEAAASGELE
jgi:hypothetical protein